MFTVEECAYIKEVLAKESKHSSTIFGDESINYHYYILKDKWILERLSDFLKKDYPNNKVTELPEVYLHQYFEGGEFRRHRDIDLYPDHYLNLGASICDDYEGGEFIVYDPQEVLPKKAGTIYSYLSEREHEVLKITKGERWSLNLFLTIDHLGISKGVI